MPTYQYRCQDCGHEFEEFQSMTEDAISVCPRCKGVTRRLISGGAGLLFKGSGFYITDYRSAGYKADQKKESSLGSGSTSERPAKSSGAAETAKKSAPKES
jgi:putative FmdB family regulatory protein